MNRIAFEREMRLIQAHVERVRRSRLSMEKEFRRLDVQAHTKMPASVDAEPGKGKQKQASR